MFWLLVWLQIMLAVAGFWLVGLALYGHAADDRHPHCAKCGYDLFGLAAGTAACPECGATLRRRGSMRVGGRHRRWKLLFPALACGAAAFAVGPVRTILWREWVATPADFVSAVRAGDEAAVEAMLTKRPRLVRLRLPGQTLLDAAVAGRGGEGVLKRLLAAGADPNEIGSGAAYRPLHRAAWEGKPGAVQVLLAAGADANVADANGETPLHFAARGSSGRATSRMLLAKNADPNARDARARTPLHSAASARDAEVVQVLVDGKADVNAANDEGRTPLHLAAARRNWDVTLALLRADANLAAKDKAGKLPGQLAREASPEGGSQFVARLYQKALQIHAVKGTLDDVREALRLDPVALRESGPDGTLLHVAAALRQTELARALLDSGADANARDTTGRTALHRACWGHDPPTVQLLLARGADVNAKDDGGRTPLHVAADSPARARTAELLVRHGADERAKDKDGVTPLEYAATSAYDDRTEVLEAILAGGAKPDIYAAVALGRDEAVRELLDRDASEPNHLKREGAVYGANNVGHRATPLHVAAWHGRLGAARLLLDAGASPNGVESDSPPPPLRTPLLDALGRKHLDVAELLLERGARTDLANAAGATPLHVAAIVGEDAVRLLLRHGAKPNVADSLGLTPLHLAAGFSEVGTVRALVEAGADSATRDSKGLSALDHALRGNRRRVEVARYLRSLEAPPSATTTGPASPPAPAASPAPSPSSGG